jgi:hypothetical protein
MAAVVNAPVFITDSWQVIAFSAVSGVTPVTLLANPAAAPVGTKNFNQTKLAAFCLANTGTAGKVYFQDILGTLITSFNLSAAGPPAILPFNADAALASTPNYGLQIYSDAGVIVAGHVIAGYFPYQRWPGPGGGPAGSPLGILAGITKA